MSDYDVGEQARVDAARDEAVGEPREPQRIEDLVSEYGSARHALVDAIHLHKDHRPEYDRGVALYDEIADRVAQLRRLTYMAPTVSAATVLRILDGGAK